MRAKIRFLLLCIFFIGSSTYLNGQKNVEPDILPMLTRTLNCSEVLRYVDDAVIRTDIDETQLLVIVRAKHLREARLVATRVKYLRT